MFLSIFSLFIASSLCTDPLTPPNWEHPGEFPKQSQMNPVQQNLAELYEKLYSGTLSDQDKIAYRKNIYSAVREGVYSPIGTVDPTQIPNQDTSHPVQPSESVWKNSDGKIPSSDFAENLGLYPKKSDHLVAGPYSVVSKDGGINFSIPTKLPVTNNGPNDTYIISENGLGVTIKAKDISKGYTICYDSGNLVRDVNFKEADRSYTIKVAQGPAHQSAQFVNATPELSFYTPIQVTQTTIQSPTGKEIIKWRVVALNTTYLVYANTSLHLHVEETSGTLTGTNPYVGYLQIAICPSDAGEASLDSYAGVVSTQGEGTFNYPGYEYDYLCEDLEGKPTAADALILLKYHAQETFCQNGVAPPKQTDLVYQALSGPYRGVLGTNLQFSEEKNLPLMPKLFPNDAVFSIEQKKKLQEIFNDMTFPAYSASIYEGGKILQNVATAIEAGVALGFDVSEHVESLKEGIALYFKQLAFDTNYHSIVDVNNGYGNAQFLNDHIVQFTYAVHAAATIAQYEKEQGVKNPWASAPSGIGNYTNKDIVDLMCRDVNNPSYKDPYFVKSRYTDIYEGHSWLSGLNGYGDGNNMESSSEALNGQLSLYHWGNATSNSDLEQYGAVVSAFEARGSRVYYQITSSAESIYPKDYADTQITATNVYQNKIDCKTFWGTNWARKIGIEFLPPNPIMVMMLLENPLDLGKPSTYAQRVYNEIKANWNWDQLDSNTIQADLVNMISIIDPDYSDQLIQGLSDHHYFDIGANSFVLSATNEYLRVRDK